MKVVILVIISGILLSGCSSSNDSVPLPPNKKISTTACPDIKTAEVCYLVPLKHNEVLEWYGLRANTKGWTVREGSDVAPFHMYLSSSDNKRMYLIVIYEQQENIETGLLVSSIKEEGA